MQDAGWGYWDPGGCRQSVTGFIFHLTAAGGLRPHSPRGRAEARCPPFPLTLSPHLGLLQLLLSGVANQAHVVINFTDEKLTHFLIQSLPNSAAGKINSPGTMELSPNCPYLQFVLGSDPAQTNQAAPPPPRRRAFT